MKKHSLVLAAALLALGFAPASSLFGQMPNDPQFGGGMDKLFGDNQTFSATMEMQMNSGRPIAMSGKMSFDRGNSRFEMDMSKMNGGNMPPQMKAMGLDHVVTISQPDKKVVYMIYPNAQAYAEITPPASDASATNGEAKVEMTELGKETVDGHPCVKNKAVVTDKQGEKHEFTVWNATDLKNFPIKIETSERGRAMTMSYSDISFSRPDASLFNPPTGYTKYDSMQELMRSVMMKKMGGMDAPPPQP